MTNKQDPALDRFRRICLGLPETSESDSWGHPNFRAGKRTFATFEWLGDRPSVAIGLESDEVDRLLVEHGDFFPTPYGRGQWISIWADGELDWPFLTELIRRGYRKVALKRMIAALDGQTS